MTHEIVGRCSAARECIMKRLAGWYAKYNDRGEAMDHIQCEDERAQSSSAQLPHTRTLTHTHVHTRAVCTTHTLDQSRLFLLFFFFLLLWRSSSAAHAEIANKHTCTTRARTHTHTGPGQRVPVASELAAVLPSFLPSSELQPSSRRFSLARCQHAFPSAHTDTHRDTHQSAAPCLHSSIIRRPHRHRRQ